MDFGALSGGSGGNPGSANDAGDDGDGNTGTLQDGQVGDGGCVMFEGVCNGNRPIDIAGGQNFGCALLASGKVWCWGSNEEGQTAQPPVATIVPPTEVPGLSNIIAIRSGGSFACALDNAGAVWCWGDDRDGQLGHDPSTDPLCPSGDCFNPTPTMVPHLAFVKSIGANYSTACATTSTNDVYCWGSNSLGQIGFYGDGGNVTSATQIKASGTALALGDSDTCVLTDTNEVFCWGSNLDEQLGHAPYTGHDYDSGFGYAIDPSGDFAANDAGTLNGFSEIASGAVHSCALADGSVTCWGAFGGPNQPVVDTVEPHDMGLTGVTQVTAGAFHSCILQGPSGDVSCWGNNFEYAVGIGPQDSGFGGAQNPTPIGVQATLIRGGYAQTLAIAADGSIWQWGGGGAFADATVQLVPRKIEGLP
jgi:alpha-tubulin suppressor-like RCC1 family protein